MAQAVSQVLAQKADHQPGDLVQRRDFDAVVKQLEATGEPTDWFAGLREYIPAEDSYIQRLNATRTGKAFLRRVGATRGGYAAIEQLASRPDGKKTLDQLSRDKDGQKMIQYIATTAGGKHLMQQVPGGKNRKPAAPPNIYTAEELLTAMHAAMKRR